MLALLKMKLKPKPNGKNTPRILVKESKTEINQHETKHIGSENFALKTKENRLSIPIHKCSSSASTFHAISSSLDS